MEKRQILRNQPWRVPQCGGLSPCTATHQEAKDGEEGAVFCVVTARRREGVEIEADGETRKPRREGGKRMEGGGKPMGLFFCFFEEFLFFALTLKDTSVLMSQKALNNTTDQCISRQMGFFRRSRMGGRHVLSLLCATMWHMAASCTAESVKKASGTMGSGTIED